ncbi:hypothetical protein D3C72_1885070 [compost metagenome]
MVVGQSRRLESIRRGAIAVDPQTWNPTKGIETLRRQVTLISPDTSMRDALQIRYETGHPLIVQDESHAVLGVLGDGELYRALLGHNVSPPLPLGALEESSVA